MIFTQATLVGRYGDSPTSLLSSIEYWPFSTKAESKRMQPSVAPWLSTLYFFNFPHFLIDRKKGNLSAPRTRQRTKTWQKRDPNHNVALWLFARLEDFQNFNLCDVVKDWPSLTRLRTLCPHCCVLLFSIISFSIYKIRRRILNKTWMLSLIPALSKRIDSFEIIVMKYRS